MDAALARLVDQVQTARAARGRLRIVGGDTKAFYGNPASGEPLDVKPLAGISSYEPSELVVTVRGGTPAGRAGSRAGRQRPAPAVRAATLRGARHRGRHGGRGAGRPGARHRRRRARLRAGRHAAQRPRRAAVFGGQVMKNVAGYDVSRALAGSMGVLGVCARCR
jgi:glycolate oxidase FAD binding subunit